MATMNRSSDGALLRYMVVRHVLMRHSLAEVLAAPFLDVDEKAVEPLLLAA